MLNLNFFTLCSILRLLCILYICCLCFLNSQLVTICPLGEYLPSKEIIYNYVCNNSAICYKDDGPLVGTNVQKTVIVYSDKKSKLKMTNLINNFSKCTTHQILQITTNNSTINKTLPSICSSRIIATLVIDLTNSQLEKLFKVYQNVHGCWKYDTQEHESLSSIFKTCNRLLFINNLSCEYNLYSLSAYEISSSFTNILINRTIRITHALPSGSPFIVLKNMSNQTPTYSGMLFEMIDRMSAKLGFNYTIVPPVDENYGSNVNGSWNGLIGMLVRKETDVVLADLTVTYDRSTVVDYSIPYFNEPVGIIVQNSGKNKSLLKLIKLFTPTVWALYLCSIFVAIVTIWALRKYALVDCDSGKETLAESGWHVFRGQVNQARELNVQPLSGRIFEIVWRFIAFIVLSTYTGGFVADLTTSRINIQFENLAELVTAAFKGNIKICMVRNEAFANAVMMNESSQYESLRKWILQNPNYYTTHERCRKLVMEESNIAFLSEITKLDAIQKEGCERNKTLIILNDHFFSGFYALGFQKNSPYNDIISSEISSFIDNGLVDKWFKNYSKEMPFCKIYKPAEILDGSSEGLSMVQIGGAFIVLGFGFVVGFIRFLCETPQIDIWFTNRCGNVKNSCIIV